MKRFRSNIKHGTQLALLALAVQFVMGFGHFHGVIAQAAPAMQSGLTQTSSADRPASPDAAPSELARQQPASSHVSDHHPGDVCAICAVIALANAVLFAVAPLLRLPQAIEASCLTADAEFVHLNAVRVAFQPRAPPVS